LRAKNKNKKQLTTKNTKGTKVQTKVSFVFTFLTGVIMEINLEELKITNNESERRFELLINGLLSKLDYIQGEDTFVITHVGVHLDLRGQGVAGKLTQAGLEFAKAKSLRVIPMCSYAAAYIRRNPQYVELTKHPGN
jgi:predicted GNAT family acetyltransferase